MNNKTIIEFNLRIIWRIMDISEGVILLNLHNDAKLHPIIAYYDYHYYYNNIIIVEVGYPKNLKKNGWRVMAITITNYIYTCKLP